MSDNNKLKKPPIGVCPKKIWEQNKNISRFDEVGKAIARYCYAGLKINIEWVEEYNELLGTMSSDETPQDTAYKYVKTKLKTVDMLLSEDYKTGYLEGITHFIEDNPK